MTDIPRDRTDQSLIALRRILRATELYSRELAQSVGLTPAQLRVLQILAAHDGHDTPTDLAHQMGVSQATVTALVDKLVTRGMVSRVPSHTDRRQTHVTLTKAGEAAGKEAPDALQQRYVREFEKLEDWQQALILAALERVAAIFDSGRHDAAPVLTGGEIRAARHE
ncbi:MarR family transcriptional regulator [Paracoccus sp. TK19116]|uniref:MarR family transcriptional regulator n=1 Tax=Paracoccus albicereus TaxID=2922394 RepID=A0ABT1MMY4_9RHOB|nr:MarR family transcriptional regulator [Paracoccus albicereus]MCQ0969632.1 MarR family transcriptional regulator [Paracoccus albicereus]